MPSSQPSDGPSLQPTEQPSSQPSNYPTMFPSSAPSTRPTAGHCTNNEEDENETDIDCGGPACFQCVIGKKCLVYSDCKTNFCYDNKCVAMPTATPSNAPSAVPTMEPSAMPSDAPSVMPSDAPSGA